MAEILETRRRLTLEVAVWVMSDLMVGFNYIPRSFQETVGSVLQREDMVSYFRALHKLFSHLTFYNLYREEKL
jgi:hypothetical protein